MSTLSHQKRCLFDRWWLEMNYRNRERITTPTTPSPKGSTTERRARVRRRRRIIIIIGKRKAKKLDDFFVVVVRACRALSRPRALFRDGFHTSSTCAHHHIESFLNLNPKRTRGTHAKEKHPFDSTERERKERERESPPRRVAKKHNAPVDLRAVCLVRAMIL